MAARISKSSIDWAKLYQLVPKGEHSVLNALRAKSDGFLRVVHSVPETPPAIDFAFYKSKIANPKIAEELEQKYKAFKVPFPQDTFTSTVESNYKKRLVQVEQIVKDLNEENAELRKQLDAFNSSVPIEHMTIDDYVHANPEAGVDPNNPTFYPHDEQTQIDIKEAMEQGRAGKYDDH